MAAILESNKSTRSENGKTTYSIRESYENDESKTLNVREVENGFIVRIEHSYYIGEGDKRSWKCDEKEYISVDNPLDKVKTPKEEEKKEMTSADIASTISGFIAGMSNKLLI
jgi:hypothetical protein